MINQRKDGAVTKRFSTYLTGNLAKWFDEYCALQEEKPAALIRTLIKDKRKSLGGDKKPEHPFFTNKQA